MTETNTASLSSSPANAKTLSDAHILEVSKSQAKQWLRAVDLCRQRILQEHAEEVFDNRELRLEVEIQFFLVALLRFYRALALAVCKLPSNPPLQERVDEFHRYLGIKRTMRNVGEHFDEYLSGQGRDRSVDTRGLQVWSMQIEPSNVRFTWLNETFDLMRTMSEAEDLWEMFLTGYKAYLGERRDREPKAKEIKRLP